MNRLISFLGLCMLWALSVPMQASVNEVANEPDSVFLFSYADREGNSGLKFAWSPDGKSWFSVADGYESGR